MSSLAKSVRFHYQFKTPYFSFLFKILCFFQFVVSFLCDGERCLCCGERCFVMPLCTDCADKFFLSSIRLDSSCRICGKPLISESEICSICRDSPTIKTVERIFPIQTYRLWKKNLLFTWKMVGKRTLSPFFSVLVEDKLRQIEQKIGEKFFIVPVPPRPGKIRKVGWDQIQELCFFLKYGFGRKILPILERRTKIQKKKLGRTERLNSIGKSYFPLEQKKIQKICKKNSNGKLPDSVILLDDIMTTGSTLEDCAEVLHELGVKKVFGLTLLIVD